jgi:hypothetical protein
MRPRAVDSPAGRRPPTPDDIGQIWDLSVSSDHRGRAASLQLALSLGHPRTRETLLGQSGHQTAGRTGRIGRE